MIPESEILFLDKIDCNFPYNDKLESLSLIDEAAALSTNALFSVIEELCRIPESKKANVSTSTLLDLLKSTSGKLTHPIKEMIVDVANKMIRDQGLKVDEVILKMREVQKYPKQFAALNILYFSCDDHEEKLESIWHEITREWNK